MLSFDTYLITFRQLTLTSMTAFCCVLVQICVATVDLGDIQICGIQMASERLNHYSRSARTNRAAKLP